MCKAIQDMIDEATEKAVEETCKAIQDMIDGATEKAVEEKYKAIQEMIDEATEKAVEKTVETTTAENIRRLIETTGWTIEQTMDNLMLPEKDRAAVAKLLEADCVHA